jgi:Translation elongation factor Ts
MTSDRSDFRSAPLTLPDGDLTSLMAAVPGMSMMDYRAALKHAANMDEAAEWLRIKSRSRI